MACTSIQLSDGLISCPFISLVCNIQPIIQIQEHVCARSAKKKKITALLPEPSFMVI